MRSSTMKRALRCPTQLISSHQKTIITLVDRILASKPGADTVALESQIDALVYRLYGLTEDEIAVVDGRE